MKRTRILFAGLVKCVESSKMEAGKLVDRITNGEILKGGPGHELVEQSGGERDESNIPELAETKPVPVLQ